jgi:hypothetical protein
VWSSHHATYRYVSAEPATLITQQENKQSLPLGKDFQCSCKSDFDLESDFENVPNLESDFDLESDFENDFKYLKRQPDTIIILMIGRCLH